MKQTITRTKYEYDAIASPSHSYTLSGARTMKMEEDLLEKGKLEVIRVDVTHVVHILDRHIGPANFLPVVVLVRRASVQYKRV
mmetsp:Transcript_18851/g.29542  ORF Transcript_18851/g.29542 Transcript_18851/m.29542 type:complete len:83 (+) Transcript_18851:36-284(+)